MNDAPPSTNAGVDWGWLAKVAPRGALAGVLAGWILAFGVDAGQAGAPVSWGGDYPAFHAAGRIVLGGDAPRLYDAAVQQAAEADLPAEGFLPFLYPPFVALAYAPLAMLPYRASYALFTLISLAALLASVKLLGPLSTTVRRDPWRAVAAALLFYPLLRSTFGGQNTALSLLVLCASWRLFAVRRDLAAGAVLGLLAYKPQLLVPVAGLVFVAGRPRAVAGAAWTCGGLYAASAAMMGAGWPVAWWEAARHFADTDRQVNALNSVSLGQVTELLGFAKAWVLPSGMLAAAMTMLAWRRGREDFLVVLAAAPVSALLIAPHAMYYDAGLALPALAVLADRGRAALAACLWAAATLQLLAPPLPLSPLLPLLLVLLVALFAGERCQSSAETSFARRDSSSSLSDE